MLFVNFPLFKLKGNNHLEYFWRKCDICNTNIDWIGKMETFNADSKYITTVVRKDIFKKLVFIWAGLAVFFSSDKI